MALSSEFGEQVIFNHVSGPDPVKAHEIELIEGQSGKTFPLLKRRFSSGVIYTNPVDVIKLISEVMDVMLLALHQCKEHPAVVLMGITGAGKSTFGNWLLGQKLVKVKDGDDEDEDDDGVSIECADAAFQVGHGNRSMTFVPKVMQMSDGTLLIDCPGFSDTNGFEVRIGMDLAFRNMIEWLKPAHVIALVPIDSFEAGRGVLLREQISKIVRLLPTVGSPLSASHQASWEEACRWKVGVTKCDKDFVKRANKKFSDAVKYLEDLEPLLSGNIININRAMFGEESTSAIELKNLVMRDTHTPIQPHALLRAVVESCFPSDDGLNRLTLDPWWMRLGPLSLSKQTKESSHRPVCLISDCLNPNDTAWLKQALSTHEFADVFFSSDHADIRDAFVEGDSFVEGADVLSAAWEKIARAHKILHGLTQAIKKDSENLMNHNILSVERRRLDIHELCLQRQCRLKLCFVEVEKKLLESQMNFIQLTTLSYEKTVTAMRENKLLRSWDAMRLREKLKEVGARFDKEVQTMGYADVGKFMEVSGSLLGRLSIVGSVGTLTHVAVTSTSLGAFAVGMGEVAAISTGACAGLLSGGALLLVGAVSLAGAKVVKCMMKKGDEDSEQIADTLIAGMQEIVDAHTACTEHIMKLGNITTSLKGLEVIPKD
eukprot:NODE_1681_length_2404_cov_7.984629.p1 GENE.NODE_1681_length_2404_cov_7.984629~~NODE_1681_length_2404_cov_7.984629.p1  ORF type:complete len:658 (-),score=115.37 NODE_1681_length_2404_cov_7.984629:311-2284(-)